MATRSQMYTSAHDVCCYCAAVFKSFEANGSRSCLIRWLSVLVLLPMYSST